MNVIHLILQNAMNTREKGTFIMYLHLNFATSSDHIK